MRMDLPRLGDPGCGCYNQLLCGGYSSVASRRSVDPDVAGSIPASRPKREELTVSSDPRSPIWLGCSGWAYPSWRPRFYPDKTPVKKLLEAYSARLNSVEVNYTFRSLPSPSVVQGWLASTQPTFRF